MNESETHTTDIYGDPEVMLQEASQSPEERADTSPIPVVPQLSVALSLLVLVFGVTYVGASSTLSKAKPVLDVRVEAMPAQDIATKRPENAFKDTTLQARSAFVWDVSAQRVLFNKNADEQLPLASITKLMTALVTYELLDPEDRVSITHDAIQVEGDSGFTEGERFSVKDLTDLTLISSSNDGAAALGARAGHEIDASANADAIFVQAMNVKADELGLTKTYFENSTGLDLTETKAGAYGSARDVAFLMEYVVTHITNAVALTTLDLTTINNVAGEYHTVQNTNTHVEEMDGLIASKTGYTSLSGGNLVVAVNVGLNHPIVAVVLGSSYDGRFTDIVELINRAKTHIAQESE
jgi:D-alanyl-D-alanine carboxypeptidase